MGFDTAVIALQKEVGEGGAHMTDESMERSFQNNNPFTFQQRSRV
jgi:hypothetical protein